MARSGTLHGNVPDNCALALLLIDVINHLEFEGGDRLLEQALVMADRIVSLRERLRRHGVPVIYVNDNFGRWQSNFAMLIAHCLRNGVRGAPLVRRLKPKDAAYYFVLKPKHSGFLSTPLSTLLDHLGARRLIVTGLTADRCVFFTASDAFMRDYRLFIPSDCVVSIDPAQNREALDHMARVLKADTRTSDTLTLRDLGLRRRAVDAPSQRRGGSGPRSRRG
jgi:nicotinamidase-related amidase